MKEFIVVIGGALSPITNKHLSLGMEILNEYRVDKIIFLPVGDLYEKKDLFPAAHRVAMLKEVCRLNLKFEVSEIETSSKKLLNTIDSLRIIQEQYPDSKIAFAMGTDNLSYMHTWVGYEDLVTNFHFMIIERNGESMEEIINANPLLKKYESSFIKLKENIRNDISSTKVRALLKEGKSVRYLVPDEVYHYIQNNNLYTLRNWENEVQKIVGWIKETLNEAGAKGVVLGLSGGLDSAVVAALAKRATNNVLALIMPCGNSYKDEADAYKVSERFDIETRVVELRDPWRSMLESIRKGENITKEGVSANVVDMATANIKPRLRMTTLYTVGQSLGYLVAGTGNKSEITMGYFTKWGDGANDFNPLANYTKTEVFEMARYLEIPEDIINKPPSANLWEGQTDEDEMGITYKELDQYLMYGTGSKENIEKIESTYKKTSHKRSMPKNF